MKERFGKKDLILLIVILAVLLVVLFCFRSHYSNTGNFVTVSMDGEVYGTYDLGKEQTITITGEDGSINVLVIKDQTADMIEADCPDMLCVKQKAISADGETIVCLPHKIVVEIDSAQNEASLDAVAQ